MRTYKGNMHSGTARIGKIRMSTMSLFETGDASGDISLKDIFDGRIEPVATGDVSLKNLIYYTVREG